MKMKIAIGIGIVMGIVASVIAMIPHSTPTRAAILTHDAQNIEQAVKQVMQTAEIIQKTQQQIELMTTNMKSLDINSLIAFSEGLNNSAATIFGAGTVVIPPAELEKLGKVAGLLNKFESARGSLERTIGMAEDVFDGNVSVGNIKDLYSQAERTSKVLEATYKDAADTAKAVQNSDEELHKTVKSAVEAAFRAKGRMEAQQAAIAISAANASEIRNTNLLLANLLAVAVEEAYTRNIEKAKILKREQESKESLAKFVGTDTTSNSTNSKIPIETFIIH